MSLSVLFSNLFCPMILLLLFHLDFDGRLVVNASVTTVSNSLLTFWTQPLEKQEIFLNYTFFIICSFRDYSDQFNFR